MCGIAGYTGREIDGLIERMIAAIRHRGPDGEGRYQRDGVHFGHTRLSIIDLQNGAQPMVREDGDIAVTYNGEIYNYEELRPAIERTGKRFETSCDTEILPLGYAAFGLDFFARLNGIFAFGLVDHRSGEVHLVRDHLGVKPLYYAIVGGELIFASSVNAIAAHPDFTKRLNLDAVRDFLQFRYVPDGRHLFEGIHTLPPGSVATWKDGRLTTRSFWSPKQNGIDAGEKSIDRWAGEVGELLSDSMRIELRSDVPVGLFLSGGVDSAGILYYAKRHTTASLTAFTYSVGGDEDETKSAAELAQRYGAEHRVIASSRNGLGGLYDAVAAMDLPVGDAIIVPTFELCRAAARERKVVLTGEGADEIFGGYVHYPVLRRLDRLRQSAPFLSALSPLVGITPIGLLDRFFHYQASLGVLGRRKVRKLLASLSSPTALARLAATVLDDDEVARATRLPPPRHDTVADLSAAGLIHDGLTTWLPYQILNKMDALSMAHGLEARVPYLDPRLVELTATMPESLLVGSGENKKVLRRLLAREGLPNASRRKLAFHVPVERDLRGELKALCDEWLSAEHVRRFGILDQQFIAEDLRHLDAGEFIASKRLVSMVGLHMWLDAHGGAG